MFLVETHIGYNSKMHSIGNFHYHYICRNVSNNNRHFGGIAIIIKSYIKPHVKILKNTNVDYQRVKLEKTFFGFKKDLFICVTYNPPISSKYTQELKHDVLDCIEKDITHYNKLGNSLLCGDVNARISCENDFILNDESKFAPIYEDYKTDKNILKRQSRDTKIDQRGKELLDLCISNQLRILNGRVLGDIFGNYTCHTPNGASVVDYVFVSENILEQILLFHVSSFVPTLSDCHCKLEWEISANYCVSGELDVPIKTYDISPNFISSDDSATELQCALSSNQIQNCISKFNNIQIQQNQTSVDDAAAELSNIFISAATMSLKRRFKKITDKPKNK